MQELDVIQKKWLQVLQQARENETRIGALYRRYAELFPEHQGTWSKLALAEDAHARLLQALLDSGVPATDRIPLDKLNTKAMDFITKQLAVIFENATAGIVTRARAVTNALLLETLVEDFLFKAVSPGSDFCTIAEQLAKESHQHWMMVDRLRMTLNIAPPHAETPRTQSIQAQTATPPPTEAVPAESGAATTSRLSSFSVIGSLAQHEECVAQLYRDYAARFPEMADFWNELANEEAGHAEYIRMIGRRIQSGEFNFTSERFDLTEIRMFAEFVENQLITVRRESVAETQALNVAKTIEENIVDTYAFGIFTEKSAAPDLRAAFASLHDQERLHRSTIDRKIAELRDTRAAAGKKPVEVS